MPLFCVGIVSDDNGFNHLHDLSKDCSRRPGPGRYMVVGNYEDCVDAIRSVAGNRFPKLIGCPECCKACHLEL